MSQNAASDQRAMLQYLYDRLVGGEQRFCTLPTIRKKAQLNYQDYYLRALADDLETAGLIITRQAYQASGGRFFQITAKGIDFIERGIGSIRVDSSAWTGMYNLTVAQKEQIAGILKQIRAEIGQAKLSNTRRANALSLVTAAEALVEAPDPPWPDIMRLLRSPVFGNLVGIAALVLTIAQILTASAA